MLSARLYFYTSFFLFYVIPFFFYQSGVYLSKLNLPLMIFSALSIMFFEVGYSLASRSISRFNFLNSRLMPSKYSFVIFAFAICFLFLWKNNQTSLIILSCFFTYLLYKKKLRYLELAFTIVFLFVFVSFYGVESKTLVIFILLYAAFYLSRFVSIWLAGVVVLCIVPLVFYYSAIYRDHPLISARLDLVEFIFQLIIGRLNMIEPFIRISSDVGEYKRILDDLPFSNSIFPSTLIEVLPAVRISDEHIAVYFGRAFYGTSDTFVSSGVFGELFGNFGYCGALYFLFLGLSAKGLYIYNSYQRSYYSLAVLLYFNIWVIFIGFETYISLSVSQFIQFCMVTFCVSVFLNVVRLTNRKSF